MARRNISLPDDLNDQMETLDINWSEVAREAFTHAVEIAKMKEQKMDKEAGIARLRGSKKSNYERENAEGSALGKEWALNCASYEDLKAVADLRDRREKDYEWYAKDVFISALHYIDLSADDILGRDSDTASEGLIDGFIDGAGDVFDEV